MGSWGWEGHQAHAVLSDGSSRARPYTSLRAHATWQVGWRKQDWGTRAELQRHHCSCNMAFYYYHYNLAILNLLPLIASVHTPCLPIRIPRFHISLNSRRLQFNGVDPLGSTRNPQIHRIRQIPPSSPSSCEDHMTQHRMQASGHKRERSTTRICHVPKNNNNK